MLSALEKIRTQIDKGREKRQPQEILFELKRTILSLLVETIWINSVEKTLTIEGEIKGTFAFGSDEEDSPTNPGSGTNITGFGSPSAHRYRTNKDVVFQLTGSFV